MSLSDAERVRAETLRALADSRRNAGEMAEAAEVLDAMMAARAGATSERLSRLDALAERIWKVAAGARDARSGMGVDLCLALLGLAYDDARAELEDTGQGARNS